MSTLVKGIHHITQCPGPAQQDLDFCTQVLGQRLVKQTVLMDGSIPIYHFYYGNADAEPGSIATSFPYSRKPGRRGSGQISRLSYAVPRGTVAFWEDHLDRHSVEHSGIEERFGRKYLRMWHPAGMQYEVVEADDSRRPWTTRYISADVASRGFFGAVMSVRNIEEQELFFVDALGFRKLGVDGRFIVSKPPATGPAPSSTCTTSPTSRQGPGVSAPARFITLPSALTVTTRSLPRRRTTKNWATPMRPR
jgi:catechol 2,3-dioxygenase-like lactoylglutathione lyase family enzyme